MPISELHAILPGVALAATVGAAIMAGLLFAFSNFVMRALLQMAPAAGMEAMQRINLTIVNPVFLLVFVGTALLSFALVMMALGLQGSAAPRWLVAGPPCTSLASSASLCSSMCHSTTRWPRRPRRTPPTPGRSTLTTGFSGTMFEPCSLSQLSVAWQWAS
jgi:hypothetical protein